MCSCSLLHEASFQPLASDCSTCIFTLMCSRNTSKWWENLMDYYYMGRMVKTCAPNLQLQGSNPTSVRFFSLSLCVTSMPSSTPSNEEVFHRILWRGCKAVGPRGPGLISLRPLLATTIVVNPKGWGKKQLQEEIKHNQVTVASRSTGHGWSNLPW